MAFNILHLLEDARDAVQRASELLKPGGLLVSVTPVVEAGVVLRTLLPLISKVVLSHLRVFKIYELNDLMRYAGFEILESEVFKGMISSYVVIARKR